MEKKNEKLISKWKGAVKYKSDAPIDSLMKDEVAIESMVEYGLGEAFSEKEDSEARKVMRGYVLGMLSAAKR